MLEKEQEGKKTCKGKREVAWRLVVKKRRIWADLSDVEIHDDMAVASERTGNGQSSHDSWK